MSPPRDSNTRGRDAADALLCSGCRTIAYCDKACQRKSWPRHKRLCRNLGKLEEERKFELIAKEVNWEDQKITQSRARETTAMEREGSQVQARELRKLPKRKGVTINSQPEYAPSSQEVMVKESEIGSPAKSILKKSNGLHISVVPISPPVKSREQFRTESDSHQDVRSPKPSQSSTDSDFSGVGSTVKANLLTKLTSPGRGAKRSLSEETFQDVLKQMEVIHTPKKSSSDVQKMEEIHFTPINDHFTMACLPSPRDGKDSPCPPDNNESATSPHDIQMSATSPQKSATPGPGDEETNIDQSSTPVNSPGLVGEVINKSLSKPSLRKVSFPRRATPHPLKTFPNKKIDFTAAAGFDKVEKETEFNDQNEEDDGIDQEEEVDVRKKLDFTSSSDEDEVDVRDHGNNGQEAQKDGDGEVAMSSSASSSPGEIPPSSLGRQEESLSPATMMSDSTFKVTLISALVFILVLNNFILLVLVLRI